MSRKGILGISFSIIIILSITLFAFVFFETDVSYAESNAAIENVNIVQEKDDIVIVSDSQYPVCDEVVSIVLETQLDDSIEFVNIIDGTVERDANILADGQFEISFKRKNESACKRAA